MSKQRPHRLDLEGQKFGELLVLSLSHRDERGAVYWKCACSCGKEFSTRAGNLTSGRAKTCGCGRLKSVTRHGMTGTPTFKSWESMKLRCTNPNDPSYARYGGRGISVCDRWLHSFENFFKDMGERPEGKTLDRKDSNGHYEPENCKWSTPIEQQFSTRHARQHTALGRTLSLAQWSAETGIPAKVLRYRIDAGWEAEKVVSAPIMPGRGKKGSNPGD